MADDSIDKSQRPLDWREVGAYFSAVLRERQARNARYSLRAFARDLGVDAGDFSKMLRNVKPMPPTTAYRLAKALGLAEGEVRWLVAAAATEILDRRRVLVTPEESELRPPSA